MPKRLLCVLVLYCLTSSCYSTTLLQEPNNLPAGRMRGAAGGTFDPERMTHGLPLSGLPLLAIGWRMGLTDWLELRLKLSVFGGEAGFNVQLLDEGQLHLHVLPHMAFYSGVLEDDDDYLDEDAGREHLFRALAVPIIASWRVTNDFELFVGPDQHIGYRDDTLFYAAGAHAGLVFHASRGTSQMLECALLFGIAGTQPRAAAPFDWGAGLQSFLTVGDSNLQCGLGFSWGAPLRRNPN
jgi:hypothetical protein